VDYTEYFGDDLFSAVWFGGGLRGVQLFDFIIAFDEGYRSVLRESCGSFIFRMVGSRRNNYQPDYRRDGTDHYRCRGR